MDEIIDSPSGRRAAKQAALAKYESFFGSGVSLADACLHLRMACTGAGHPLRPEEIEQGVAALQARLATWSPQPVAKWARLDAAFREMVEATIAEVTDQT